jgi:hypothetical protein
VKDHKFCKSNADVSSQILSEHLKIDKIADRKETKERCFDENSQIYCGEMLKKSYRIALFYLSRSSEKKEQWIYLGRFH